MTRQFVVELAFQLRKEASCANIENISYKAHTFSSFADPV